MANRVEWPRVRIIRERQKSNWIKTVTKILLLELKMVSRKIDNWYVIHKNNLILKNCIWCINLIRFLFFFLFLRNLILRSFITWQRSLARLVLWMRNISRLPFHLRNVHILHWRLKKWTLILHDNIVDSTGCDTANNIIDCTHTTNLTKWLSSRPSETPQISNNYISLCSWDQRRWCRRNINLVWTYHSRLLNISLPRSSTSSWLYYRLST